jgi:hypothetical protein
MHPKKNNNAKIGFFIYKKVHFKKNSMQSKNNELFNNNASHIKTQQKEGMMKI